MLRKQLRSLPATLPQTYERILLNIEENYSQYVLKMLQWLTYSKWPLSLLQLAEVVAIDEDEDPRFDPERRFPDPEDILLMCSSLVTATVQEDYPLWDVSRQVNTVREVRVKLAHFSVKEYLVSSQIMNGEARKYSIHEIDANVRIARDCLSYILYFTEDMPKPAWNEEDEFWSNFSLAQYAAQQWQEHAEVGGQINEESMMDLIMELFTSDGNAFSSWCLSKLGSGNSHTPLTYASTMGLLGVVRRLIIMGVDVNASSGPRGNALCVASFIGHTEIVKLLLEMGADPNSLKHGWTHGSPVYWASSKGHGAIVRLLLDAGAEIGLETGVACHSALHAAAWSGNTSIVAMLISSGMDVNLNPRGTLSLTNYALSRASWQNHDEVVKLLVEAGADPDSNIAALHIASRLGLDKIVEVLLGAGADLNRGWQSASPLREAVEYGYPTTVKILLDAGADADLGGSWDKNCFYRFDNSDKFFANTKDRREVLDLLAAARAEIFDLEEMMKELKDETEKTRYRSKTI